MDDPIEALRAEFRAGIGARGSRREIEDFARGFLGQKGSVKDLLRSLGALPAEERPAAGQRINALKEEIEAAVAAALAEADRREREASFQDASLDVTLPGRSFPLGRPHLLTQVRDEVVEIFVRMGYQVEEGPEVETDWYNFGALGFPEDHPARDMQDTFHLSEGRLLRTHTSNVQIRVMERRKPPLRVIGHGRVYRCDDVDATHSPVFHQIEGFMVGEGVTFATLKGALGLFAREMFGPETRTRFRPSFFPFTEPSAEVDISCIFCGGSGCRLCKQSGWIEILGCGMIDPAVYESVGYDPESTGFAFGMGVERIAMLRHGVTDIRLFYENDLRF
ncbi:MAG: phenylalanine--tRNA ligase subunit alpha, partial [Candidatus Methylomirabilis sp.]|nr:phenylalanine--tRNA ligase subunit alpha [Deltaproteobacteria bacterium]